MHNGMAIDHIAMGQSVERLLLLNVLLSHHSVRLAIISSNLFFLNGSVYSKLASLFVFI